MFKNYMLPHFLMEEDDGTNSGGSDNKIDVTKIDWSTFDITAIPEDVIKKTKTFTAVKDEAASRRKENTQLKKQVEASVKDVEVDVQEEPEKKPDDIPQWAKELQKRMDDEKAEKAAMWRTEAATLYNIKSPDVAATLKGETRAEVLAAGKKLAEDLGLPAPTPEQSGINPNIIVGNPVMTRDKGFLERVKSEMYGQRGNKQNPFSPDVQRVKGGGAVIMDD